MMNINIKLDLLENDLLMTKREIEDYNIEIKINTKYLYEIDNITNITGAKIKEYICSYKMPTTIKYDCNHLIKEEDKNNILENCNLNNIQDLENIPKGLTIKRSNIRSFPTNISFYDKKGIDDFDRIQETELSINSPLLVLHESKDHKWYFIISKIYAGWIESSNVILSNEDDWNYFIKNDAFGIITEASVIVEDIILDMGTSLPYLGIEDDKYIFSLPDKNSKNQLIKRKILIDKNLINIGFLPYTKKNIVLEAFKYINYPYSWGGKNKSVDCSSFIMNIFKTFGFEIPRNSFPQKNIFKNKIDLQNLNYKERLHLLKDYSLALLYMPGHVMLYLGYDNEKYYIIHANGRDMAVTVTNLKDTTYIEKLDTLIDINLLNK